MSSTQEVGDIFGQGKGSAQAMLRSPTVLILCVGLWGMNLFFYKLFGLDYKYILNYDLVEIRKEELRKERTNGSTTRGGGGASGGLFQRRKKGGYHETATEENDLELTESGALSPRHGRSPSGVIPKNPSETNNATTRDLALPDMASPSKSVPTTATATLPNNNLDFGAQIKWFKLVLFSVILLLLLHTSTHYWMDHLHRSSIGAVFFFYVSMLAYICFPVSQNVWLRRSLKIVGQRTWALIHPRCSCITLAGTNIVPRRVPFVDVFFADAMCSLSKVFFDWGMLGHQAIHYPHPVPAATHNIVVPSLCAALPYLIRARQCLVMFTVGRLTRDPHKHHHLMNAFKYSTSMYPLILSAYLKTFTEEVPASLERLLLILLIINSSYSLWWDIVMDWGMMQDPYKVAQTACAVGAIPVSKGHPQQHHESRLGPCQQAFLRPSLRYGPTLTILIVVADSFLRFSWTLKFVPNLFPSIDAFVLCTEFLEVFRRAIWNLLRVEWENIKQQKKKRQQQQMASSSSTMVPLKSGVGDALPPPPTSLGSSNASTDLSEDLQAGGVEMKILR